MTNPAFEYLRLFKEVKPVTEDLVLKTLKRKYPNMTFDELTNAFELGLTGEFGKVYSADPQCLIGWVDEYMNKNKSKRSYYEDALLDNTIGITDRRYPTRTEEWLKEVNKCYTAYLKGVSTTEMHPHVYDTLVMDRKVERDYFEKYLPNKEYHPADIRKAKHQSMKDFFEWAKSLGNDKIYYNE
jgi:hypothetical protein